MAVNEIYPVIVSGAGQGIGRQIAVEIAASTNHPLVLISRSIEKLEETAAICREEGAAGVFVLPCDLTDEKETNQLSEHPAIRQAGMLVNNAGSFLEKPVLESGAGDFLDQYHGNLLTAVNLTKVVLPHLIQRDEARLVFTCSVTAQKGQARCGAYSASKQALNGYIQSLRETLLESSVGVTSIILGQTWSDSWHGSGVNPERLINPADVGKTIVWLSSLSRQTCVEEIVIRPQKGDL